MTGFQFPFQQNFDFESKLLGYQHIYGLYSCPFCANSKNVPIILNNNLSAALRRIPLTLLCKESGVSGCQLENIFRAKEVDNYVIKNNYTEITYSWLNSALSTSSFLQIYKGDISASYLTLHRKWKSSKSSTDGLSDTDRSIQYNDNVSEKTEAEKYTKKLENYIKMVYESDESKQINSNNISNNQTHSKAIYMDNQEIDSTEKNDDIAKCRQEDTFLQECYFAVHNTTYTDFPPHNTVEYYEAAQNYALFGTLPTSSSVSHTSDNSENSFLMDEVNQNVTSLHSPNNINPYESFITDNRLLTPILNNQFVDPQYNASAQNGKDQQPNNQYSMNPQTTQHFMHYPPPNIIHTAPPIPPQTHAPNPYLLPLDMTYSSPPPMGFNTLNSSYYNENYINGAVMQNTKLAVNHNQEAIKASFSIADNVSPSEFWLGKQKVNQVPIENIISVDFNDYNARTKFQQKKKHQTNNNNQQIIAPLNYSAVGSEKVHNPTSAYTTFWTGGNVPVPATKNNTTNPLTDIGVWNNGLGRSHFYNNGNRFN